MGDFKLQGIRILGQVASHSSDLATMVIQKRGLVPVLVEICDSYFEAVRTAAVKTVSQIGRHSSSHCKAVASTNVLPKILSFYLDGGSSAELKQASGRAL